MLQELREFLKKPVALTFGKMHLFTIAITFSLLTSLQTGYIAEITYEFALYIERKGDLIGYLLIKTMSLNCENT